MDCRQGGHYPILNSVNNTQGAFKNKEKKDDKEGRLDLTKEKAEVSTNQLTAYSFKDPTMVRNPCRS